jgi:hypothetical protein
MERKEMNKAAMDDKPRSSYFSAFARGSLLA